MQRIRLLLPALLGLALVLILTRTADAATITVTTTADEFDVTANGTCSLREAIQAANTLAPFGGCSAGSGNDVIQLAVGTYTLTLPGANEDANRTGDLDITSSVTISGAGAASTVIHGNAIDRVVHVRHVTGTPVVTISGLTIRNGSTNSFGGGILNDGGTVYVTNSALTGNSAVGNPAGYGGAIFNNAGTVYVTNSVLTGNSANLGGAIFNNDATLTVTNSTLSDSSAVGDGGGIANDGTVTVTDSTLSGNTATGNGGGIFNARGPMGGTARITNSTFSGNVAGSGGSGGSGGAIYNYDGGTVSVTNATFSGGSAGGSGAGVFNSAGTVTLRAAVLDTGPSGVNCGGPVVTQGANVANDATCFGNSSADRVVASVGLGPLADNGGPTRTHALMPGSPAIDAVQGSCTSDGTGGGALISTDQRGVARPIDGNGDATPACDSGAQEAPPFGRLQFTGASATVPEGGGSAAITVTRVNGSAGALSATVTTSDGTATAPADYSATALPVSFADGESGSKTVQVPIVNDALDEPDEVLHLTLASSGVGATIGTPSTVALTILDDDPTPTVCGPRPNVAIQTAQIGPGQIRGTLTVGRTALQPSNTLQQVQVTMLTNATATVNGVPVGAGQTVTLPPGTTSVQVVATRTAAGAFTARLSLTDECGAWPTLIGGGTGVS